MWLHRLIHHSFLWLRPNNFPCCMQHSQGTFGLLGINATVNMGLRGFVWSWVFTFPAYWVGVMVTSQELSNPFPGQPHHFTFPDMMRRCWFSLFSSALAVFCSLIRASLTDEKWHCLWFWLAFSYWLIMLNIFIYLLAIFVSPLEKHCYQFIELCWGFMCSSHKHFWLKYFDICKALT